MVLNLLFTDTSFTHSQQHYISVNIEDLFVSNDTLAILSTPINCTGTDGGSTWELFLDPYGDGMDRWFTYGSEGLINDFDLDLIIQSAVQIENMTTSLNPFLKEEHLTLYPATPNPASDKLTIKFDLDRNEQVLLQIYHADGRQILTKRLGTRTIGQHTETINVNALPTGNYLYGIKTESARLMNHFVIQR